MRLAVPSARHAYCCSFAAAARAPRRGLSTRWSSLARETAVHPRREPIYRRLSTAPVTLQDVTHATQPETPSPDRLQKLAKLPVHCPGCGAPSQIVSPEDAGYYTLTRQGLRKYLRDSPAASLEDTYRSADAEASVICDRCHNLLHHAEGAPIFHPSIQSIHEIIEESPHKNNHIYHILDAADLPMSLIPSLQNDLRLPRLRSQNRRSKHNSFTHGRSVEVSFIITRADLLAPKREQVDSLMPYLREVLRDALGHARKNVRLGNLRCVSAKRGWWTTNVKEDIWVRGGAGWMVGKVNVGKSSLFEVVFPKGRGREDSQTLPALELQAPQIEPDALDVLATSKSSPLLEETDLPEITSLLPPARPEVAYPAMPIASSLPGTTASPIRVPFGSGRGELIDLPGVARSSLEAYVLPSSRESLVMRSRVAATQHVIKPGQSLLLGGGLIRITPTTPDQIVLAYPFLPLDIHVTSTAKAVELQSGIPKPGVPSILSPEAHLSLASAGVKSLKWDITRARAGPLTAKSDVRLKPSQLAFTVWGADLVVEGVGWVELVAQTRRAREAKMVSTNSNPFPETMTDEERLAEQNKLDLGSFPKVEVFSPNGKHVMLRRPMNAWLLGGHGTKSKSPGKARPKRSMTSLKQSKRGREMASDV